jgi:ammonia channel protein AmtB
MRKKLEIPKSIQLQIPWSIPLIIPLIIFHGCSPTFSPGMAYSMARTRSSVVRVPELTNAVIGGLVASCACCTVIPLPIAPLVGLIASLLTLSVEELLVYVQVDDAVGAVLQLKYHLVI